ncbi:hypothetical protein [Sporosalibacterium faouarense]|uniref:hypothetical protein n=1 Tax=Sporosalibacterium faouarense TaxID=516123 RepID=UPI00141D18EF|nr:hypothetical protein [Sporosalibacterium faouarense]MTI46663.1 hypothetical protein [Bacillota bacterium]
MDYKFRELKFQDVFALSKIIKKTGIKDEMKSLFTDGKNNLDNTMNEVSQDQGLQLAIILFENIHRADKEICEFISSLSGIKTEDIMNMSLEETMNLFYAFGKMEGIGNFLKSASKLMQ